MRPSEEPTPSKITLRLRPGAQAALEALRLHKMPPAMPRLPITLVVERALLALAEAEGIEVAGGGDDGMELEPITDTGR